MTQKSDTQPPEIRLNCCQGNPAPPSVIEGWRRLLHFSQQARSNIWGLLVPALMEPASPENRPRLESFCQEHGLVEEDVVAAVRSCDFLLRQASALDLGAEVLKQDLTALSEGHPEVPEIILSQYDKAKVELRKQIIQESLADHGKVLVGLDWRVDSVTASDRGVQLNADVVFLTLRYRDGDRVERITLQLSPESIKQLKLFSDRFAG